MPIVLAISVLGTLRSGSRIKYETLTNMNYFGPYGSIPVPNPNPNSNVPVMMCPPTRYPVCPTYPMYPMYPMYGCPPPQPCIPKTPCYLRRVVLPTFLTSNIALSNTVKLSFTTDVNLETIYQNPVAVPRNTLDNIGAATGEKTTPTKIETVTLTLEPHTYNDDVIPTVIVTLTKQDTINTVTKSVTGSNGTTIFNLVVTYKTTTSEENSSDTSTSTTSSTGCQGCPSVKMPCNPCLNGCQGCNSSCLVEYDFEIISITISYT